MRHPDIGIVMDLPQLCGRYFHRRNPIMKNTVVKAEPRSKKGPEIIVQVEETITARLCARIENSQENLAN